MNNKIQPFYVDYKCAKKLRALGFDVPCELFYEWFPHFLGEPLSFDDECELKSEGRENEITYKELIQKMYNTNDSFKSKKNCSCPSLDIVREWLLVNFNIHISPNPSPKDNHMYWLCNIWRIHGDDYMELLKIIMYKRNNHQALADGIEWAINYLIENKKNEARKH